MRILISGANGFIGSALGSYLRQRGHTVTRLVRRMASPTDIVWNPIHGQLAKDALAGFEVVIHLAGANVAAKRWTEAFKQELRDSRIKSAEFLVDRLMQLATPPAVMISMSGVGYYGNCGDRLLDESSLCGDDFMARLCLDWESATHPLTSTGARVVNLRTGLVLSADGGALKKMLLPFKLGLGGRLGSGNQYWSWIALADFVAAVEFIVSNDRVSGPVNMVSPNPVTNREFTIALAKSLGRPAILPVPAFALRAVFGEMADNLFFAGQRVMPLRLTNGGFAYQFSQISSALNFIVQSR